MPQGKFSKAFDYRGRKSSTMTSYPSGYEGDIPQSHYEAAVAAGALEGGEAPAKETSSGGGKSK